MSSPAKQDVRRTLRRSLLGGLPFVAGALLGRSVPAQAQFVSPVAVTASGSTTARTLADRFADVVNVKDFGAVGDGVADDTAAIAAAITRAEAVSAALYIPAGTYNVAGSGDAIFTLSKPIPVYGDGWASLVRPITGVPTTRDVFLYNPVDGTNGSTFPLFHSFRIQGQTSGVARYGIHFAPTEAGDFVRRFGVERMWFQNLNSFAVFASKNAAATSGSFVSWLRDIEVLGNGFGSTDLYDSILLDNCVFAGTGYAVDAGFTTTGPGKFIVRGCNVTASSGMRFGGPITGLSIIDNYFETQTTYDGANNAFVDLNGASGAVIVAPRVVGNIFTVLSGDGDPDALRINYCNDAAVDDNIFSSTEAAVGAITITANANRTHVGVRNTYTGALARLANAGSMTTGGSKTLISLNADSSAVADTTSETSFGKTLVLPAAYLKAGQVIRIRAAGRYSTTGTPVLTIKQTIGGAVAVQTGFTTTNNAADQGWITESYLVVRTTGAGAEISRANGVTNNVTNATSIALNTNNTLTIDVTATWGAASALNTVVMTQFVVELSDGPTLS